MFEKLMGGWFFVPFFVRVPWRRERKKSCDRSTSLTWMERTHLPKSWTAVVFEGEQLLYLSHDIQVGRRSSFGSINWLTGEIAPILVRTQIDELGTLRASKSGSELLLFVSFERSHILRHVFVVWLANVSYVYDIIWYIIYISIGKFSVKFWNNITSWVIASYCMYFLWSTCLQPGATQNKTAIPAVSLSSVFPCFLWTGHIHGFRERKQHDLRCPDILLSCSLLCAQECCWPNLPAILALSNRCAVSWTFQG